MALQGWLMRRSLSGLAGFGAAGVVGIIGGALAIRQAHLRSCPVVEAADQQLRAADAVRALLGSPVASTSGVRGGYTDPINGTACITFPVVSEGGVRAIARIEAEAEWLLAQTQAKANGQTPPEPPKAESPRWFLRHLELELETPPAAANASADASSIVLYSLPRTVPLSVWAPSREPSALPRWLRALLPEPSAVANADATPQLLFVGVFAIAAHAAVFGMLHRRAVNERMLRRAETMLTLPESTTYATLATRALEIAAQSGARGMVKTPARSAGAPLYGHADSKRVLAFSSLTNGRELFFKAERTAATPPVRARSRQARAGGSPPSGERWTLVELSMAPSDLYSKRLSQLPPDAKELELLETMLSVEMEPVDMLEPEREVLVPSSSSGRA